MRIPIVTNVLMVVLLASLVGCSSSAPRFGSRERHSSSRTTERKPGPRFSSKESEEEVKETDKHVDTKEVERITSGERDFKKEKNPAIKALDQSKMMREISKYMGVPYKLGGAGQEGMDCSGYTMLVYKNAMGIQLPRTSAEQTAMGNGVRLEDLKFGDLIFFNTTGEPASHVGIYLGDDLFAHASVTFGVTISSLQSSYYSKRFEQARRIVK